MPFLGPALTAIGSFLAVDLGLPLIALQAIGLAVDIGITTAITAGISALNPPPEPQVGKVTIHQERPQRRYGVGRFRGSGPFMLREAKDNHLLHVIALPEGPVDHYGQFWLNDDAVIIDSGVVQEGADRRYPDGRVTIDTRLGENTETAYTVPATYIPSLWGSDYRGDGIPSMMLHAVNGDLADQNWAFPNGEPTESVEIFYRVYDWRDDAQDRADNTTWTHGRNPIVWAVNVLWRRFGSDWDICFAPVLDDLTVEADYCDEEVDLKAGGSEPRYECGFFFDSTNAAADVMGILLASMDGWWATRFDGAYVIKAGRLDDPFTVGGIVLGDMEVLDYSFDPGPTPDAARNVLVVSFTDPANSYSKVETTPWIDEDDVLQRGEERSDDFYPWAVQSNGQVRRLAKRQARRNLAPRVQIRTPLSARRGMTRRYVGLNVSECADLSGATLEVSDASIDLRSQSITWTGLLLDASIDDWDPDTEEGDGPAGVARPPATPSVSIPSILDVSGGSPEVDITIRFPSGGLWDSVALYRDTNTSFAGSIIIESALIGGLGEVRTIVDAGLAPGTYYYFARSSDSLGNLSAVVGPAGPITVT